MNIVKNYISLRYFFACVSVFALGIILNLNAFAQNTRTFSGAVVTQQFELIPEVNVEVETSDGKITTKTDAEGRYKFENVANGSYVVIASRPDFIPVHHGDARGGL